jgi:hypothetical protein
VTACGWTAQRAPAGQALPTPTPLFVKFDAPTSQEAAVS